MDYIWVIIVGFLRLSLKNKPNQQGLLAVF